MNEVPAITKRGRPRWFSLLVGMVVGVLVIIAAAGATLWWMYTTSSGLQFVVLLNSRFNTALVVRDVSGSLRDGFAAGSLTLSAPTWSMQAADFTVEPFELRWRRRSFDFERIHARSIVISWTRSDQPATAPTSLAFPVDLRIRNLTISELRFGEHDRTPNVINNIAAAVRLNANESVIERGTLEHGPTRLALNGRVDARRPFGLRAEAQLTSTLRAHEVSANLSASGTLLDAFVQLDSNGADARLKASARLTPFAPVPLAQLSADVDHFNLPAWVDGAPAMRLRGSADLKPIDAVPGFSVAGPFSIENLEAGPVTATRAGWIGARLADVVGGHTDISVTGVEGIRGSAAAI